MRGEDGLTKLWPVVRVAAGNFLEAYDFQVFGYYAAAIGLTFFPSTDPYASLLASLATFGAGFLMRPLGAIILGAYVDHRGRRAGLLLTLGLMAIGTLSIACTPGYARIGLLAPLLVLWVVCCKGFRRAWSWAASRSTCWRSRRGPRVFRELAIGYAATGSGVRGTARLGSYRDYFPSQHDALGLAHSAAYWLSHDSVSTAAAALAR